LAEQLRALQSEDFDIEAAGFTDDDLSELIDGLSEDLAGDVGGNEPRPTLADRFIVPPFSVLDARQGYWQDRKRAWLSLGIQSELGRGAGGINSQSKMALELAGGFQNDPAHKAMGLNGGASPGGSPRPAMKLEQGRTVRGDGRGRKLT